MDLTYAQHVQAMNRAQQLENSARLAHQTSQHQTSGSGWIAPKTPITFDTKFIAQPAVFHGSWLAKAPDPKHYSFPQVSGGVTNWVMENGLYVGAYLWFNVRVDPIKLPRTDGSNLTVLTSQLASDPTNTTLQKLKAEAQEAVYLLAHPPTVVVQHNLLFMAVGVKGMPSDIMDQLHSDTELTPLTLPIYANS